MSLADAIAKNRKRAADRKAKLTRPFAWDCKECRVEHVGTCPANDARWLVYVESRVMQELNK